MIFSTFFPEKAYFYLQGRLGRGKKLPPALVWGKKGDGPAISLVLIFAPHFDLTLAGIADFVYIPFVLVPRLSAAEAEVLCDFFQIPVAGEGIFVVTFFSHNFASWF